MVAKQPVDPMCGSGYPLPFSSSSRPPVPDFLPTDPFTKFERSFLNGVAVVGFVIAAVLACGSLYLIWMW